MIIFRRKSDIPEKLKFYTHTKILGFFLGITGKKRFIVIFVSILEVFLPDVCNLLKIGTLFNFQIKSSYVNGYIQNQDRGKNENF